MLKKILALLSDAAIYGVANALSQLINFFLLPLFTAYLTKTDYGVMGRLGMFAMVFASVANLGMTNAIYRRYNTDKQPEQRNETLSTGLASVLLSCLSFFVLCQLAARPLAGVVLENEDLTYLLRLSFISAALVPIGNVPLVVLRASRRVKTISALSVAKLLFSIAASLWFVIVQDMGVLGYVTGILMADVVFTILNFVVIIGAFKFMASWEAWKKMAAYGLPFIPHHLMVSVLYQFSEYMAGNILGLGEAGLYNMAAKFAVPVSFVVGAINSAWGPYKFQIHADDDEPAAFFRTAVTFYCVGVFYLWVGVSVWAPEMVVLMTTAPFHPAAYVVPFVALVPVSQGLFYMLGTGIELTNNTRQLPLISVLGLATVVVGSFTLIKWLGLPGAALSTTAGWLVMAAMAYSFARRRIPIHYDWPTLGGLAAMAVACVALAHGCRDLADIPRLAIYTVISLAFPLVAVLILLRSKTERARVQMIFSRLRRRKSPKPPAAEPQTLNTTTAEEVA